MAIRNYRYNERGVGTPQYWDGFDVHDYQAARQSGYSDSQIRQWLDSQGYMPGNPDVNLRVGPDAARLIGYGSNNNLTSSVSSGGSSSPPPATSSSNDGMFLEYEKQLADYRDELSLNRRQLYDYESQLGSYKSDLEFAKKNYEDVLGKYNSTNSQLSSLTKDLDKVKADSDLYRSQLDSYKADMISQQLDTLRRGTGTNQGPSTGQVDLASGGAAVTSARGGSRDSMVNVEAKVDATDSVLDRKGPVVEVLGGNRPITQSSYGTARQRALAAGGGSSAAGYYASRFG